MAGQTSAFGRVLIPALAGILVIGSALGGCTSAGVRKASHTTSVNVLDAVGRASTGHSTTASSPQSAPAPLPTPSAPNLAPPLSNPSIVPSETSVSFPDPGRDSQAIRDQHDADFAIVLKMLSGTLMAGNKARFLIPFAAPLAHRVGHWFVNTRTLGVAATVFARADDFSSGATDSADSFTRTVVPAVRTPFDDSDSMAGIPYAVGVSVATKGARRALTITGWQPKYLDDPMNCDCTLSVVRSAATAVVANASDRDLTFWSEAALRAADSGIAWSHAQLAGSPLVIPHGQVIFLADKPFRWFLSSSGPEQKSNVTAGLVSALGDYPGTVYSDQSRIVLMLRSMDGTVVPNDGRGRQYAQDVLTHESTHQLMNRNSTLPGRSDNSPPSWVVEGIAVAVETLHRDALANPEESGYPEPNDPKNIDRDWLGEHLTDQMPTNGQLYSLARSDSSGYYAIAGSVFRYIAREYGYPAMLAVAKAMYAKPAQNPFAYFPDQENPGSLLPAATAKSRWRTWFVNAYE
ncbi:MAG: hypothetical protein M3Y35_05300 [Actinomycetota bacterium]|nr:hypothetical protein [Actinomycetota bacterium]